MSYQSVAHGFLVEAILLDNTNFKSYNISETVHSVMVKKAFLNSSFPLYVLNLRCSEELRNNIRDNDVSIDLKISYYKIEDESNADTLDSHDITPQGIVFNGVIRLYEKPFDTTYAKYEEDSSDGIDNQTNSVPFVYYTVSGIPESLISKNEECLNNIFKNSEVVDAAINLISSTNYFDKVYIEKTKNRKNYPFIIIPPINLVPAIKFLDEQYGFYDNPANIFIDDNSIYLYDPFSKETTKDNTLEVRILNSQTTTNLEENRIPSVDSERKYPFNFYKFTSF